MVFARRMPVGLRRFLLALPINVVYYRSVTKLIVIGVGGFIGAVARYSISGWASKWSADSPFPYGTLAVNLIGCFIIGAVMTLVEDGRLFSPQIRLFVTVGVLGSLTTFSTFGFETIELLRAGSMKLFLLNIGANVILGLIAVMLGRIAVRAISF